MEELYIDKIDVLITELSDIIEHYDKPNTSEEDNIMFYSSLQIKVKAIYEALNLSAICGEYVTNNTIETRIVKIKERTGNLITAFPEQAIGSETIFCIVNSIIRDLGLYCFCIHSFWASVKNPKLVFIDYDIVNEHNRSLKDKNIPVHTYSKIFRYNYFLLLLDKEFSLSEHTFQELNSIKHDLQDYKKEFSDEKYIDVLIHKCQILLAKFNYKDSIRISQYYNYYNNSDELAKLTSFSSELYSKIQKVFTSNEKDYIYNITELYDICSHDKCRSFFDFFIKCHYFKNIVKNETLLSNLIAEFTEYQKSIPNDNVFDKMNALSCLNYLNNCRLSLLLKQSTTTKTDVHTEFLKIKNIQDNTSIRNYFPYMIIAEWYNNYLSNEVYMENDLSKLESPLYHLKNCLTKAEEYLNESKHNAGCFIPFKPPFDECIEDYRISSGETIKIFISTSYIIPVDYEKAEKRIKNLHANLIRYNAIIDARKSINATIDFISTENKKLHQETENVKSETAKQKNELQKSIQSDLKENQKNNIQILAIFAGIVVFASGSIQIFTGATNVKDASIFMLLFASSLSIISLTIWLITSQNVKWNLAKTIISLILFILLGLNIYAIFGNWGTYSINDKTETEMQRV